MSDSMNDDAVRVAEAAGIPVATAKQILWLKTEAPESFNAIWRGESTVAKEMRRIRRSKGIVYIIQSGDRDLYKIGFTNMLPRERMSELQTGNPDELYLRAWGFGSPDAERAIHIWLDDTRVRGEWFAGSDLLRRLVGRLNRDIAFGCFAKVENVLREFFGGAGQ